MKQVQLDAPGPHIDYHDARVIAVDYACTHAGIGAPVLMVWHDKKLARFSPGIPGARTKTRWHDYGRSHAGCLVVSINGEYDFIFAEGEPFITHGVSPYINIIGADGNHFLCLRKTLHAAHQLDEYTSKLT